MTTITKIEAQRAKLTAKLAQTTDPDAIEQLVEKLWTLARQDGQDDLMIDLKDADLIDDEAIEFAKENNGTCDPRR